MGRKIYTDKVWISDSDSCAVDQALTGSLVVGNTDAGWGAGFLHAGSGGGEIVLIPGTTDLVVTGASELVMQIEIFGGKADDATNKLVPDLTQAREVITVSTTLDDATTITADTFKPISRCTMPVNADVFARVSVQLTGGTATGNVEVAFNERGFNMPQ